jgi:hypothetical protein
MVLDGYKADTLIRASQIGDEIFLLFCIAVNEIIQIDAGDAHFIETH